MPAANLRKKRSPVFVPSKPWASAERSRQMPGTVAVPGRFFELVYVERGRAAKLGKTGLIVVSATTLNRLMSNPGIPSALRGLFLDIAKEKKVEFTKRSVLAKTDAITKILDRKRFSPDEFSFLENLRIGLIRYRLNRFRS